MLMAMTHLPAQVGCFCMARESSRAISSALGYRVSLPTGQNWTVLDGPDGSGNGLPHAHADTILEEEIVEWINAATAVERGVAISVAIDVAISAATGVVLGAVTENFLRKLSIAIAVAGLKEDRRRRHARGALLPHGRGRGKGASPASVWWVTIRLRR
jgi:hypothetical protein